MEYPEMMNKARNLVEGMMPEPDCEETRILIEDLVERFYGLYSRIEQEKEEYKKLMSKVRTIRKQLSELAVKDIKLRFNLEDGDIHDALDTDCY